MQRITITLDDDLMDDLDRMIADHGYQNRSEAIRDFTRAGMQQAAQNVDEKQFVRLEAIINSMTPRERRNHEIISGTRRKRIAAGSGTSVQEVNQLLRQYAQMAKMFKQVGRGGLAKAMMRGGLAGMGGRQRFGR